jgi:hypothetical protein
MPILDLVLRSELKEEVTPGTHTQVGYEVPSPPQPSRWEGTFVMGIKVLLLLQPSFTSDTDKDNGPI